MPPHNHLIHECDEELLFHQACSLTSECLGIPEMAGHISPPNVNKSSHIFQDLGVDVIWKWQQSLTFQIFLLILLNKIMTMQGLILGRLWSIRDDLSLFTSFSRMQIPHLIFVANDSTDHAGATRMQLRRRGFSYSTKSIGDNEVKGCFCGSFLPNLHHQVFPCIFAMHPTDRQHARVSYFNSLVSEHRWKPWAWW